MLDPALDVGDAPAGIALVPGAVELLGRAAELHNEVAGQVLRLGFAAFLAPKADQGGFIAAHDDPGVRAADECAAITIMIKIVIRRSPLISLISIYMKIYYF